MRTFFPLLALFGGACIYAEPYGAVQALDYHIDRPRVAAVTFDPPWVRPGQPVVIDALVLTPRGEHLATR